jgi:hypothetical protein
MVHTITKAYTVPFLNFFLEEILSKTTLFTPNKFLLAVAYSFKKIMINYLKSTECALIA